MNARQGDHIAGKTIVVTGAAGGFGRLLAERTAAMGARVGACDIDGTAPAELGGERIATGAVDVAIKVTNVRATGVPGTGLGAGILNGAAVDPVLGANRDRFYDKMAKVFSDDAPEHLASPDSIGYAALSPDLLADQIIHAIDQPWGVAISDVTIRASNDDYLI